MYFLRMLWREVKGIFHDRDIIVLLSAGPICLTLLFGGIYMNSYIEDIPIAVLDEDNSSLSRRIVQQFEENDRFYIKHYAASREELQQQMEEGQVHMGLYIPIDFGKRVNTLQSSEVLVMVDGTNMIIGNNSYAAAAHILQTIAAGTRIKVLQAKGVVPQMAQNMALPFQFNERVLYDPRMTYMNYLMLGFVAVFLQQVMISGIGISLIKDRKAIMEEKTILKILVKILASAIYAVSATFIAVGILHQVFGVPLRGRIATAFLLAIVFVFAISCPAILLAALTKDKLKLAQIAFMLSLPTFVSCGYVWPLDQMPSALVPFIKICWPLVHFARPFDEVLLKGLSLQNVQGNMLQMLIYTLIWMPVSIGIFKVAGKREGHGAR